MVLTIKPIIILQNKPEYTKDNINFERFSFDAISLVGEELLNLTIDEFDTILRETFHSITFSEKGKLQLLDIGLINSVWDHQTVYDYLKNINVRIY